MCAAIAVGDLPSVMPMVPQQLQPALHPYQSGLGTQTGDDAVPNTELINLTYLYMHLIYYCRTPQINNTTHRSTSLPGKFQLVMHQ